MPFLDIQLIVVNGVVCAPLRKGIEESTVSTATRELFGVARFATAILTSGLALIGTPLPSSAGFILKVTSVTCGPFPIDSITAGAGALVILNFAACAGARLLPATASSKSKRVWDKVFNRNYTALFLFHCILASILLATRMMGQGREDRRTPVLCRSISMDIP